MMSILFGTIDFELVDQAREMLPKVRNMLSRFSGKGAEEHVGPYSAQLYRPLVTTSRMDRRAQPHMFSDGCVLMLDGRIDNSTELRESLRGVASPVDDDAALAASLYMQHGSACFSKIIGDWALSIWDPRERCLVLARDFIGIRPLFYLAGAGQASWCSIPDPLLSLAKTSFSINEQYLAGWLAHYPSASLTPYEGLKKVPPGCYVRIHEDCVVVRKYWSLPTCKFLCRDDAEYEECFRRLFAISVERRLRSDFPILAELSGGMDSSAIVCMADKLRSDGVPSMPPLRTVTYYDNTEPNWDELHYAAFVEQQRGEIGSHIDVHQQTWFGDRHSDPQFEVLPGSRFVDSGSRRSLASSLQGTEAPVLLSGLGGDEVLGGVPNPLPELANLLAAGHLRQWHSATIAWAKALRRPVWSLMAELLNTVVPSMALSNHSTAGNISWLNPHFRRGARPELNRSEFCPGLFGLPPSLVDSLMTLDCLRRQLSSFPVQCDPVYELRYPYLDKNLLEFLFRIPPEQLVRPAERRSLMKRALKGIVPEPVLERRRKAFVARAPVLDMQRQLSRLIETAKNLSPGSSHVFDSIALQGVLASVSMGKGVPLLPLIRTFALDAWFAGLEPSGFWNGRFSGSYEPEERIA